MPGTGIPEVMWPVARHPRQRCLTAGFVRHSGRVRRGFRPLDRLRSPPVAVASNHARVVVPEAANSKGMGRNRPPPAD